MYKRKFTKMSKAQSLQSHARVTPGQDTVMMSLPTSDIVGARNVQMSKEMYEIMVARMHKQESKLKASSGLHLMLMSKDETIKNLKERIKLLERSSSASELRLANLIRMHMEQSQHLKSMASFVPNTQQGQSINVPAKRLDTKNIGGNSTKKTDIETDCAESLKDKENMIPPHVKSPPTSLTSVRRGSAGHSRGLSVPGISKSLFDRVVSENIRLKKVLEDSLSESGRSVEGQLVSV